MKITKRQLRRIIREESKKHPALKGDQDKLPKGLQKAIIDKADDEWEEQNESSLRAKLRNMISEVTVSDNADEVSEELSVMRDTISEIQGFCENGNMDFSMDGQTRVAALLEQVIDLMEEAIAVTDEDEGL